MAIAENERPKGIQWLSKVVVTAEAKRKPWSIIAMNRLKNGKARLVNQELLSFDTYSEKLNIIKTQTGTAQQC